MNEGLELRTDRLILRRWRPADRPPFAALNADPEVMEHFVNVQTREQSDGFADHIEGHFAQRGYGLWAVEVPGVKPFIGFVGLAYQDFTQAVEVGWRPDKELWGRGYATEAARAAVADGFERVGLDEIVSYTVPANMKSRAVMERLGMTRDPADDFDHPRVPEGHPLRRHVLYRLSRERWKLHS